MALKSYHKETLNDNWYEERSGPLNGVLPNDRVKEYSTTTNVEFPGTKPLAPRGKPRMVNERSLGQALLQSAGADISHGFRSSLPLQNEEEGRRYLETTHHAAFGVPSKQTNPRPLGLCVAAGRPSGSHVERGKSTSGAAGETFTKSAEPQRDTASQRSWLYSMDPMISTISQRSSAAQASKSEPTTNQDTPITSTQTGFRRQSSSITSVPLNHRGVFMDD